ncbi:MAG: nucleotidyl transferase AbiEii/AbiGii toxin family protein [Bellilinea sp.]
MDTTNFLETLIGFFKNEGIRFCVIGGQAVNAYVEPLVSLDLDLAVAVDSPEILEKSLAQKFNVQRLPHRLNVSLPGSDLRVQIQADERYQSIVNRASEMNVLGMNLPVASLEDILQGKIWAMLDPDRRGSKRQKDLADIARILESFPHLRDKVPAEILKRLEI